MVSSFHRVGLHMHQHPKRFFLPFFFLFLAFKRMDNALLEYKVRLVLAATFGSQLAHNLYIF